MSEPGLESLDQSRFPPRCSLCLNLKLVFSFPCFLNEEDLLYLAGCFIGLSAQLDQCIRNTTSLQLCVQSGRDKRHLNLCKENHQTDNASVSAAAAATAATGETITSLVTPMAAASRIRC